MIPRATLTLKLQCYSLVDELLIFPYFPICFQYIHINSNKPELILISHNPKMPNAQLFQPVDWALSGSTKIMVSIPLMMDLAIGGQIRPLILLSQLYNVHGTCIQGQLYFVLEILHSPEEISNSYFYYSYYRSPATLK